MWEVVGKRLAKDRKASILGFDFPKGAASPPLLSGIFDAASAINAISATGTAWCGRAADGQGHSTHVALRDSGLLHELIRPRAGIVER